MTHVVHHEIIVVVVAVVIRSSPSKWLVLGSSSQFPWMDGQSRAVRSIIVPIVIVVVQEGFQGSPRVLRGERPPQRSSHPVGGASTCDANGGAYC